VAGAVVVARDAALFLVTFPPARPQKFDLPPVGPAGDAAVPPALVRSLAAVPADTALEAESEELAAVVARATRRDVTVASLGSLRRARAALPGGRSDRERRFVLETARSALEQALTAPEEILITLAREEERVDRAVGREARASESFLTVPGSPLSAYAGAWSGMRASLETHHDALRSLLASHARSVLPNLSAVVGERTAARLLSAAGNVSALSRMRAGRIQLLGSRRRPSPERGPRYGVLYRADRMDDVPLDRRGAFARSLAAIAAIAVRADATTRADIAPQLVARRDRRVAQLQRRRR
jgi:snoRNA binding domain, fibrillarin